MIVLEKKTLTAFLMSCHIVGEWRWDEKQLGLSDLCHHYDNDDNDYGDYSCMYTSDDHMYQVSDNDPNDYNDKINDNNMLTIDYGYMVVIMIKIMMISRYCV